MLSIFRERRLARQLLTVYGAILEKDTAYGLRRICELRDGERE